MSLRMWQDGPRNGSIGDRYEPKEDAMNVWKIALTLGLLAASGTAAYQLSKNKGLTCREANDDCEVDFDMDEAVVMD